MEGLRRSNRQIVLRDRTETRQPSPAPPPPPQLPSILPNRKEKYDRICSRLVIALRYIDEFACLQIVDDLMKMISTVGLGTFVSIREPAYVEPTYEFLISIIHVPDEIW